MNTMSDQERRDIEDLLPWYVAGTLERRDMRRVEEALARDAELARKYESILEELAGTVELNETLGAPSTRAMEKLFANIDAEPVRPPVRTPGIAERFSLFLASLSPRTLAWSASAAVLVILLQAGLIGGALLNPQAVFEIASGGSTASTQGVFALIRFAPEANAADIAQLLEGNNVSIADGPLPGGLYRIRAAGNLSQEEATRIIERLRENTAVSFIAPTE